MWQPEQPSSQTVAILILLMTDTPSCFSNCAGLWQRYVGDDALQTGIPFTIPATALPHQDKNFSRKTQCPFVFFAPSHAESSPRQAQQAAVDLVY
jgi:hypothetical protein